MDLNSLVLESEVIDMLDSITEFEAHVMSQVPHETLFTLDGQPNVRSRWGAILFHLRLARATLKGLL